MNASLPGALTSPASAAVAAINLNEFAARSITRFALMDLRIHAPLAPPDFRVAYLLVDLASEFTPDDPDSLRLRAVIADSGGDKDSLELVLRRLLAGDPRDTAVQYRLIALRLGRIQLAEDRLRAYERFLGPEGANLDGSIRSRLATDAAFLHRERGEAQGFVDKLKIATALDSTNHEAARAALDYFDQRVDDPIARLDLLANLLYADIADPQTHDELARALAGVGVFDGARRFTKTAQRIRDRAGLTQDAIGFLGELATDWCVDGAASVTQRLSIAIASRRQETEALIKQLQAQLVPTDDIPKPEDVRLDARLDRVRLLAARTVGDQATIDGATTDLRKSYDAAAAEMQKMAAGGQVTAEDVAEQTRAIRLELITLLALANVEMEQVGKDFDAIAADPANNATEPGFQEALAWLTLRRGGAAEALGLFEPIAPDRPNSRIGIATAHEALGQKDAAIATYRSIVREFPISTDAAWAVGRLLEISGVADVDPDVTPKARLFFKSLPDWLDETATDPSRFMALGAELARTTAHNLERSAVHVRLTNTSTIPLAVGPGATIDSRSLVAPQLEIGTEEMRSTLPEAVDLQRRLRLLPNQAIDFTFWPDPGLTGWLIETNCRDASRTRFRVIQGYIRGGRGEVLVGPMSLASSTLAMVRSPLAESKLSPAEFVQLVIDAPEDDIPRLVTVARSIAFSVKPDPTPASKDAANAPPPEALLSTDERASLAGAFSQRYARAGTAARAVMLAGLPHTNQVAEFKAFDDTARSETDPNLIGLFVISRVNDVQDPVLVGARSSTNVRLAELAKLHSERLTEGKISYFNMGPGIAGLLVPPPPRDPEPPK